MKIKRQKPYKYDRIVSEVERIITEVIDYEISDPRVTSNCTVTGILLSKDYSYCKVYVEILGDDEKNVLEGLKNSSGYIRHIIRDQLDLRKVPELAFIKDDTKEKAKRIEELLEQIK